MITNWKNNTPPEIPFYAVIFISKKGENLDGYFEMDDFLMKEAHTQDGFLGYSSNTRPEGGIFISYWKDESAIEKWRNHATHKVAKGRAYDEWYDYLHTMICKVESSRIFERLVQDEKL